MIRLEEVSLNGSRVHLEPGNVFELGTFFGKRLRIPNQWWPRHVGGCTSCVPSLDGRGERAGCWRNVETPWGAGLRRLARNFLFFTFFPFLTRLPFRRWCAAGSSRGVPLGQIDLLQLHELLKRGRWKAEGLHPAPTSFGARWVWRPGLERDLSRGTVEFVLCGLIQP